MGAVDKTGSECGSSNWAWGLWGWTWGMQEVKGQSSREPGSTRAWVALPAALGPQLCMGWQGSLDNSDYLPLLTVAD